jgi:hypothetical protein
MDAFFIRVLRAECRITGNWRHADGVSITVQEV